MSCYLFDKFHALHALEYTEELVIRGSGDFLQAREGHLPVSLEVLSDIVLANTSRFGTGHDMSAVGAQKVSLEVISGNFLASTDWAGRL
ncbi:MAG: hypothetical protein C4K48_11135 [Candidatus Thorarchaeota archaeon]|nr:MAG: hypothetical protein C4K48_11135 [Candidatus Thorarchaeota archaeon]